MIGRATVFLRQLERLRGWARRARGTGYFDEGYAAAQLWLADWEAHGGDDLCARAQGILQALDPLRMTERGPEAPRPQHGDEP